MILESFSCMNTHGLDKNRNSCGESNVIRLSHLNFYLSAPQCCQFRIETNVAHKIFILFSRKLNVA
jgi:hypothetical protein